MSSGSAPARWTTTPFSQQRNELLADQALRGSPFTRAYAALVDGWLASLLADDADVAVVAVGGYGRGELFPGSDLDIVLVHRGRPDIAKLADQLWYPIWNAGLKLDHSVRTVKEAMTVADRDLKCIMGLLDARLVAGDGTLARHLIAAARDLWQRRAKRWLPVLDDAVAERHSRAGELAFLLEPDIKEAKGGLRDINALRAAALAGPGVPDHNLALLDRAEILVATRVALQRRTGKAGNQLLLQDQEVIAHDLGVANADTLVHQLAAAGRSVGWASDDSWRRIRSALAGPKGRVVGGDRPLDTGVVARDGEITLTGAADVATDGAVILRVAAAAANLDAPIVPAALTRLAEEAPGPGDPWPQDALRCLLSLLHAGQDGIAAFEAIDQYGLLERILPEWRAVRNRPQHNPYHRYTVDRHLLETVAHAARLTNSVHRPDLLLVAAWLHDLGKGYPGDHVINGTNLAVTITARMGFPPDDVGTIARLVQHHLLLAETATRRDINDPDTGAKVSQAMGDLPTLHLLHALTAADAQATGETSWTPWKQQLVQELVDTTSRALENKAPPPHSALPKQRQAALIKRAAGELLLEVDGAEVVVVAPDRAGWFAAIAGVLILHGIEIVTADAISEHRVAVDRFIVQRRFDGAADWSAIRDELVLAASTDDQGSLDVKIRRHAHTYRATTTRSRQHVAASATVDNDASARASVVEVRAPDQPGALYRIGWTLATFGLDIRHAKILTLGPELIDNFYVTGRDGGKITNPEQIDQLRHALIQSVSEVPRATEAPVAATPRTKP